MFLSLVAILLQLFDMKKFQANVSRELRQAYPDRRRLECQCISSIAFVKSEAELLDSPVWVMIINVVALDMLKAKLPPGRCTRRYHTHQHQHTKQPPTEAAASTTFEMQLGDLE
jgi:hypothetical protein